MTSAFCPHSLHHRVRPFEDHPSDTAATSANDMPPPSFESETEDEEVKINCVGGLVGMQEDSDINTEDSDEDDWDEESADEDEVQAALDRRVGVVSFVSRLLRPSPRILKPRASRLPHLSPPLELDEQEEEEDDDDGDVDEEDYLTTAPEVGARGVALSLEESEDEDTGDQQARTLYTYEEADYEVDEHLQHQEHQEPQNEEKSVSGSDADESDMDDDDDDGEQEDSHQDMDYETTSTSTPTLQRPALEDGFSQELDSASVILQVLEDDDDEDEEISSLIVDSTPRKEEDSYHLFTKGSMSLSGRHEAHLIGVAHDRESENVSVPRVKRVMSLDETMLNQRDVVLPVTGVLAKKRRKSDADECLFFSLGPPAEPPLGLGGDDVELDGQLRYELESTASSGGDQSPVPLLTPPDSPVMGETCEWPSNLVVDSAMTAVLTQVRPLDIWTEEREEDQRLSGKPSLTPSSSELTPLFRGIQVSPL